MSGEGWSGARQEWTGWGTDAGSSRGCQAWCVEVRSEEEVGNKPGMKQSRLEGFH